LAVLRVEGIGLDMNSNLPNRSLESRATNSVTTNGPRSSRCYRANRVAFGV